MIALCKKDWRGKVESLWQNGDVMVLRYGQSGGLTEEERVKKENWVIAVDAIVNKEMARERRWQAWFIRSFKGVMWRTVGNWLSLKESSRETERGRQQGSVCVCVCMFVARQAVFPTHAHTHFLALHAIIQEPSRHQQSILFPTGQNKHHSPPTTSTTLFHSHSVD